MTLRPNILFIVADDLNSWIGALGRHPQVQTPNIDRLAGRGTNFTRAYCPAPYCNASRMAVFTGLLPSTSGIYQNEPFFGQPGRAPTYFEQFRKAGYRMFGAGKVFHGVFDYRHAGSHKADAPWVDMHEHDAMWDNFVHPDSEPMPENRPLNGIFDFDQFEKIDPWNHHFDWGILPDQREAEMPDHKSVSAICDFLAAPPANQPFFCAAGLYKPHLPWYAPKRFFDMYPLDDVVLPLVNDNDLDDVPEIARLWARTPDDHAQVLGAGQWQHAVQGYLAAISYCDAEIGRLLDALDASPAGRDTIIVLWGDNGFHLGEKLHWRKFVLWEEATRVPLIVSWPGHVPGSRIDIPTSLIDLFPTLSDLTGVPDIPGVNGQSLCPLFEGAEGLAHRPVLTTWQEGNHSLRSGDWRYTRYHDGSEELYNHRDDPLEWTNLVENPAFKDMLVALRDRLLQTV